MYEWIFSYRLASSCTVHRIRICFIFCVFFLVFILKMMTFRILNAQKFVWHKLKICLTFDNLELRNILAWIPNYCFYFSDANGFSFRLKSFQWIHPMIKKITITTTTKYQRQINQLVFMTIPTTNLLSCFLVFVSHFCCFAI